VPMWLNTSVFVTTGSHGARWQTLAGVGGKMRRRREGKRYLMVDGARPELVLWSNNVVVDLCMYK
jgi:hypothetical protein